MATLRRSTPGAPGDPGGGQQISGESSCTALVVDLLTEEWVTIEIVFTQHRKNFPIPKNGLHLPKDGLQCLVCRFTTCLSSYYYIIF